MSRIDSIWVNVQLATMAHQGSYGIIEHGAVAITDGRIVWIGEASKLSSSLKKSATVIYNGEGRWMTPGLIDCHTHLIYAGNRIGDFSLKQQGKTYEEIAKDGGGIQATVSATRNADSKDLYTTASKRLSQLISDGVTALEIKSGYGLTLQSERQLLEVATALRSDFGMTIQRTFLGAHILPLEYREKTDAYIEYLCTDVLPVLAEEKLVDCVDAFCERIAFTPSQVEKLFTVSKTHGIPVKLHADQLSNTHGAQLAAAFHALSADHLDYISSEGVQALAKAGTTAVLLPGATYFLKSKKIPPVALLKKYAVNIALATDFNPGTSPILSIRTIMNMGCLLYGLTPLESLQGVTIHAAAAMGLEKEIGSLQTGKKADCVVWDITQLEELSYGIGLPIEKIVICSGKILYGNIANIKRE